MTFWACGLTAAGYLVDDVLDERRSGSSQHGGGGGRSRRGQGHQVEVEVGRTSPRSTARWNRVRELRLRRSTQVRNSGELRVRVSAVMTAPKVW